MELFHRQRGLLRAKVRPGQAFAPFAQGLLVDVFADRFELRARDFARNETIGAPQILPIASAPC